MLVPVFWSLRLAYFLMMTVLSGLFIVIRHDVPAGPGAWAINKVSNFLRSGHLSVSRKPPIV